MQRLDRILSEAGIASRKELRAMIRAGRVTTFAPWISCFCDGR